MGIVYIIVTLLCFNKLLLIVNEEFFLSLNCQNTDNFFQQTFLAVRRSSEEIVLSPIIDLSSTTWAQKELINQRAENAFGSHGTKATIENPDKYRTTYMSPSFFND